MKMKLLAGALAALSLAGPVQAAGEFSDASAVSKNLQFIAGAVEFGFNLTALPVQPFSVLHYEGILVGTFEVTSSEPRQLAIGWDTKQDNNIAPGLADWCAYIQPIRGGRGAKEFCFGSTQIGPTYSLDGNRFKLTKTPVTKLDGNLRITERSADGAYRLSLVAAVYNP